MIRELTIEDLPKLKKFMIEAHPQGVNSIVDMMYYESFLLHHTSPDGGVLAQVDMNDKILSAIPFVVRDGKVYGRRLLYIEIYNEIFDAFAAKVKKVGAGMLAIHDVAIQPHLKESKLQNLIVKVSVLPKLEIPEDLEIWEKLLMKAVPTQHTYGIHFALE